MTQLSAELGPLVVAACQTHADEISAVLACVLTDTVQVAPGEAAPLDPAAESPSLEVPGMAFYLGVGQQGLLVLLGEDGTLLNAEATARAASEGNLLSELARDLARLVLPSSLAASHCAAQTVPSLAEAAAQSIPSGEATLVRLALTGSAGSSVLRVLWPVTHASAAFATITELAPPAAAAAPTPAPPHTVPATDDEPNFDRLPGFARSLLRIRVPVAVELASTRLPLRQISELVPGTIIQFSKSCEEMLRLRVGSQNVAEGEAVKVGDKFGLRLTSMVLPAERFRSVGATQGRTPSARSR